VLALLYDWRDTSLVTLHNFSNRAQNVRFTVGRRNDGLLVEVFDSHHSRAHTDGAHRVRLEAYAWRWYRVGSGDNILDRSVLTLTDRKLVG
jgi:maltose alpha-D-glucosyltransferase/alpha-amylase